MMQWSGNLTRVPETARGVHLHPVVFSPRQTPEGLVYGDGKSDPLLRGENGNGKCEGEATILKECNGLVT
jgi:hypothetical protein